MILDMTTVVIIYATINIVCALFMVIMWNQNHKHFSGIGFWLTGMILQAVGGLLIILTGIVPAFISQGLSNIVIVCGILIIYIGLNRFIGKNSPQIHNYILVGIFTSIQVYFTYYQQNYILTTINLPVITLILTSQIAWFMLYGIHKDMRRSTRIVGIVFSGYAFISFVRIIYFIIFPGSIKSYLETGAIDIFIIIFYTLLSVGLIVSLILMINSRLINEIKYMSFHDYLTGLYNRAFFEEELRRLDVERNLPLSVIHGDVNGLKITNDSYGHEKGDELLVKIADILRESFRKSDIISRWGGDEFIILLPKTKYGRAEEIVRTIEENCIKYGTEDMPVSISLGISTKESENESIEKIIKAAEDSMYRNKTNDEKKVHRSMISSLEKTLEKKDYETEKHIKRMEEMALLIGKNMELSKIELNELTMLSALHDIGKISIADNVILKPGKLTPGEWELVKKHPEVGYRIAKSSVDLAVIAESILSHHENWDGSGYPESIKGTKIPLLARIISIVDSYDAMTNDLPYKKAMDRKDAIDDIKRYSGIKYDPELVKVFLGIIERG